VDTALGELEYEQLSAISIDFWVPTEEEIAVQKRMALEKDTCRATHVMRQ
jgi:hypothetical protein